jgi:hypothetical protein
MAHVLAHLRPMEARTLNLAALTPTNLSNTFTPMTPGVGLVCMSRKALSTVTTSLFKTTILALLAQMPSNNGQMGSASAVITPWCVTTWSTILPTAVSSYLVPPAHKCITILFGWRL